MRNEDVTKLPKWAQSKIEILERDIAFLKKARKNNWSEDGETDTFIRDSVNGNIPLPRGSAIIFEMGDELGDRQLVIGIEPKRMGRKRKVVEVHASGRMISRLVIESHSSNTALLSNKDLDHPEFP